jgi:hypothetical protein
VKKLCFLVAFSFFICLGTTIGQTITPNKIWEIESGGACLEGDEIGCFCYAGIVTIKTGAIKTFNDKEYYELLTSISNQQWEVITYVREENDKVFFYVEECDKEWLMYDYNLEVGDEVFLMDPLFPFSLSNHDYPCELDEYDLSLYNFTVTEIDSIEYNDEKRKMLRLECGSPYRYDIWIEGIGCMRGITFHAAQQISGVKQLKNCYESNALVFVNENPEYCWVYVGLNDEQQSFVRIFTNGQNNLHILNAESISLIVYDIHGNKVHTLYPTGNNYLTNLSFLPKGIYVVANQKEGITSKIIVQ